jgi:hypothetical protein
VTASLERRAPGEPLLLVSAPNGSDDRALAVRACSPGPWDLATGAGARWPRVPGATVAVAAEGSLLVGAGFVPCGGCPPCSAGRHLACVRPARLGWDRHGGMASHLALAASDRAWLAPVSVEREQLPAALALLAGGGLVYQAAASVGMVPGDVVVVLGDPGPGRLPLVLLDACGFRVVAASCDDALPAPEQLGARCHLVDLAPGQAGIERWLPLSSRCISATLVGPLRPLGSDGRGSCASGPADAAPLQVDLERALAGACTLRWVRDLHPQLALDVVALAVTGRVDLGAAIEVLPSIADAREPCEMFLRGDAERWPVLLPAADQFDSFAPRPA